MSPRELTGWSVLLVVDREEERSRVRDALLDVGFDVVTAGDGDAALLALHERAVQIVLVDARVLEPRGLDLVTDLHRHAADLHVVVMTTGLEDERVLAQVRRADGHIVKPFATEHLVTHLIEVLRRRVRGGTREASRRASDTAPTGPVHQPGIPAAGVRHTERADPAETELVADMVRGLEAGEFEVFYQPIVRLRDRSTVGYEALVRWRHPERGLVPPVAFIGAAERSGLIVELGDHVLARACEQARIWLKAGHDLHVAVNLSARQLVHPGLADRIGGLMAMMALPAGSLWLEVTETALIEDIPQARDMLERIEAVGAWLSIDDFGTGWASLTYLRQFPSHAVKIDKSFVSGLGTNASDEAIVRSILLLGHALDLTVIAEGVETEGQAARLLDLDCELAQGYLFGHPLPVEEIRLTAL